MEEVKLSNLVIKESDREYTVSEKGENFTIRIPLPSEKAAIIAQTARSLGGLDIKCYPPEDYSFIRMIVTLNNVIVNSPKWWNGAEQCPDESLLMKLWNFYLKSENEFQAFLKKNNRKGKSE
jgi:hypothetical protein